MPTSDFDRWSRIEVLFHDAIELPEEERASFLERLDLESPSEAADVRSLVESHEQSEGFLEGAATSGQVDAVVEGEWIGPYRLVRMLGKGGMGVVYLVQRDDLPRPVALKVLQRGLDSDELRLRFLRERRILAGLDHPNIARLYDGGVTDDGRPYFVMEYVDGEPIDVYCDRNRLPVAVRLALFHTVCRAIQHAHQRLIVHRDLKPSNVLVSVVEGRPVVKLLDFGIARLVEETEGEAAITRTEAAVFTPEYAAPEQIRGEPVTTATDVYALGILLYELLVGERPYDLPSRARRAVEDAILNYEPRAPSTRLAQPTPDTSATATTRSTTLGHLTRLLRSDLDHVTLKAMRKEPDRRYESAAALADDVARHLDGRAVEARGGARRYRARRFIQRYRRQVGVAAAFVVVLLVGLGAALWQAGVARTERATAVAEAQKQTQMRAFAMGLFASANPEDVSYDTVSARTLLDRGADRIRTELVDQPYVQAQLMADMADIYRRLAAYDRADSLLADALPLVPPTGTASDTTRADLLEYRGVLLRDLNRYGESEALLDSAHAINESLLGSDHRRTIGSLHERGLLYWAMNRLPEAADMQERELAFYRAQSPIDTPYVASALNNLGLTYWYSDSLRQASAALKESVDLHLAYFGRHVKSTSPLINLGSVTGELGDEGEGLRLKRLAYDIRRDVLGPDHPSTASAQTQVADRLIIDGRYTEALAMLDQAEAVYRASLGEHPTTARILRFRADALYGLGRRAEALALARDARDMAYRTFSKDHRALGWFDRLVDRIEAGE